MENFAAHAHIWLFIASSALSAEVDRNFVFPRMAVCGIYYIILPANDATLANATMPANVAMPAVRQNCTYGNMAESELICVIEATLLRNKYASILRAIS